MEKINSIYELKDKILMRLYSATDVEQAVNDVLELVGKYFNVSRAYIFENSEDDLVCTNTFEWCNEGIWPEIQNLQHVRYLEDLGGTWLDNFNEDGMFICPDIKNLPEKQREVLEPQGIHAMLQSAIWERGLFKGYIGFDNCKPESQKWENDKDAVDTLLFTSRLLTMFLLEQRNKNRLLEKSKELETALHSANVANKEKSAFLSRISHDMRTPLNGILGLTELMRDKQTWAQIQDDLMQMEISGRYLLNLVNDTLDVSKIENGSMELHPIVCNGKEVFESTLSLLKPNIEKKKIQFDVHADNIPFGILFIDVGRTEQLVMNILSNAIKFTPEGGKIEFTMRNISESDTDIVDEITVKDSGIGISKDFLPNIFMPFKQEFSETTSKYQGTGLGMTISKQIVDLMGGTIKVESELGKGTTFIIRLPFKKATREQIASTKQNIKHKKHNIDLNGKIVLLCEDHPLNAQIAKRLLAKRGIVVEHAQNGKIGVDMFSDSKEGYYSAVLMDIRMPIMDGLEATKEMRKLNRKDAGNIPIIAMSANAFEEDMRRTDEAGMDAHLSKPIDSQMLFETLEEKISERYLK